jgi:hypothetical protein
LIWPAVIPTVCKIPGDNVLEFYEWTDTESMSIWLTRSLSQSPTDVKSRSKVTIDAKSKSFMLRGVDMVEGRNEDESCNATRTRIVEDSPARLSILIKIGETRKKQRTYMSTIAINTF